MSHTQSRRENLLQRPAGTTFRRVLLAGLLLLNLLTYAVSATEEVTIVRSSDAGPYKEASEKIRAKLAGLSYGVEVVNLADLSDQDEAKYKQCIADNKVKLFVAIGTQAATWLHARVPQNIGVIYCMVADPDQAGLIKGRISQGITTTVAVAEQVRLIRDALPQARRIGMLYARKDPTSTAGMNDLKAHLPDGFSLVAIAVEDQDSINESIQKLLEGKPDVVWTAPDAVVYSAASVRNLLMTTLKNKIAVFGFSAAFVKAGALLGVGVEPARQGEQCGELAGEYMAAVKEHKETEFQQRKKVLEPRYQLAVNKISAKQLDQALAEEFIAKAEVVFK